MDVEVSDQSRFAVLVGRVLRRVPACTEAHSHVRSRFARRGTVEPDQAIARLRERARISGSAGQSELRGAAARRSPRRSAWSDFRLLLGVPGGRVLWNIGVSGP